MNKSYLAVILCCFVIGTTQARPQQEPGTLPQEVTQIRNAMAGNQQKLHGYQWIETVTLDMDGTPRAPKRYLCGYGPDGKLERTSLDQQSGQSAGQSGAMPMGRGGLIRQAVAKRKKEKYKKKIEQIRALMRLYMPPDAAKLRAAASAGQLTLDHSGTSGDRFVIDNYAKQGDRFTVAINPSTMQLASVSVKSWLDKPKDSVSGEVRFDRLPDGTVYPASTTLNISSGHLTMTIVNSDYSRPVH